MGFNNKVGVNLIFREEAGVDESLGRLNASKHPVDEDDEHGAENEKRHVNTKGCGRIEGLECVLEQHGEDGEDEAEDGEVEPNGPASDDQAQIATRGRRIRSLFRGRARAFLGNKSWQSVSIFEF